MTDFTETPAVAPLRAETDTCRWQSVGVMAYKEEGSAPFKDITRQTLFDDPDLKCQVRYFEMAAGGHSTLERHEHMHAVMILRGEGHALVGTRIFAVKERDLVNIPGMTWHQFRATGDAPMGFLCVVNQERDKPQLPTEEDLRGMRSDAEVAAFIRC
ncbi:MAG: cupin domain-containing protein [Betaproteobacteria bacterium]|nr:cupin domain-containing protein [Betaproteobacteria bacterium]